MNQSPLPFSAPSSENMDLKQIFFFLRGQILTLVLVPLIVGALTYAFFSQQSPTYQSVTSLMSTQSVVSGTSLSGASISAPQLPQGAVEQVVHSRRLVEAMREALQSADLPAAEKFELLTHLREALQDGKVDWLTVRSRLDTQQRGVYEIRGQGPSPAAARELTQAAAQALINWDRGRALEGVTRARQNIQRQLTNLGERLQTLPTNSPERDSLNSARGQLMLELSQATVQEQAAIGSLSLLLEATTPQRPIAPRTLRNVLLAGFIALLLSVTAVILVNALRRRVTSSLDLLDLGLPVIGELPKLGKMTRNKVTMAVNAGKLYEAAGFIRVNLTPRIPDTGAIIAVTSARPGEGKSTSAVTVAISFANAQKRVLLIDLDLHRPTQSEFWPMTGGNWVSLPGSTQANPTTVSQAFLHPDQASALDVGSGIHLLPAGRDGRLSTNLFSRPDFGSTLARWSQAYDIVVVDTPPLLALADGYGIARFTHGLLLVVESESTSIPDLYRLVQTTKSAQIPILGVILNKINGQSYYSYNYTSQ